jgi:hypothetical protein
MSARRHSSATSDFFVCKANAFQRPAKGRVMNLNTLGIGQCIAQFEQCDVGILLDQFHKECLGQ